MRELGSLLGYRALADARATAPPAHSPCALCPQVSLVLVQLELGFQLR